MRPPPSAPLGAGVTGMLSSCPCRSTTIISSRPGLSLRQEGAGERVRG